MKLLHGLLLSWALCGGAVLPKALHDASYALNFSAPDAKKTERDLKSSVNKFRNASAKDMLEKDFRGVSKALFVGWNFKWYVFVENALLVMVGCAWMAYYHQFIYTDDRGTSIADMTSVGQSKKDDGVKADAGGGGGAGHGGTEEPSPGGDVTSKSQGLAVSFARGTGEHLQPDLVMVFQHPDYDSSDKDTPAQHATLVRALPSFIENWRILADDVPVYKNKDAESPVLCTKPKGELVSGAQEEGWIALDKEPGHMLISYVHTATSPRTKEQPDEEAADAEGDFEVVNLERIATSGHLFNGFRAAAEECLQVQRTATFASRLLAQGDGEEKLAPSMGQCRVLFLQDVYKACEEWGFDANIFSSIDDDELFVCLTLSSADTMNKYLFRDEAQLRLRYDIAEKLGIKQPVEDPCSTPPSLRFDPLLVEHCYKAGIIEANHFSNLYESYPGRDPRISHVSSQQRMRMMYMEIARSIDLDSAKEGGVIVDWYPAHSKGWLTTLHSAWASPRLLTDMLFRQPIHHIGQYFGVRVAFMFAWNGLYCKVLLALVIFALAHELVASLAALSMTALEVDPTEEHHRDQVLTRTMLGWSLVVTTWARWACNLWDREQEFYIELWELATSDGGKMLERPKFKGKLRPSPVDLNQMHKTQSERVHKLKIAVSSLATLGFCAFVTASHLKWANTFADNMSAAASIVLAVSIQIYQFFYSLFVPMLVEWENHKYEATYYDRIVFMQVVFQFVNNYTAFAYLTVTGNFTVAIMREQLQSSLLILTLSRVATVALYSFMVKLRIWWEDYQLKRSGKTHQAERRYIEEQSKFNDLAIPDQVEQVLQLVIALGFVCFFGCVAPLIVPFCLVVFMVYMRAFAWQLCHCTKRVMPKVSIGIGLWRNVVGFLMYASIFVFGFLNATYCDIFKDTPILAKGVVVLMYLFTTQLLWFFVDAACPSDPMTVALLRARRDRVKSVLLRKCEGEASSVNGGTGVSTSQFAEEVEACAWSKIPHLSELEPTPPPDSPVAAVSH